MRLRRDRTPPPVQIVRWGPAELVQHVHEAMRIYAEAMAYPPEMGTAHVGLTVTHTARPGFRATAALSGSELAGFSYGYTVARGQWWFDQVRGATAEPEAHWLEDAFELCELHVLPKWQGRRIGRNLLLTLVEGLSEEHVILSTPEGPTRAWSLYRSLGFADVLRNYHFTGDSRAFAVLGARLPLADGTPDA